MDFFERVKYQLRHGPYITIWLIIINCIIFFLAALPILDQDEVLMNFGVISSGMKDAGEWYRFITACFIHFDFEHLVSNMFMLGIMGYRLEEGIGHFRFALLYLLSGIGGNVIALVWHIITSASPTLSAGASGAIYGIVGGLFAALLRRGGSIRGVGSWQLAVMLVFMIYTSTFAGHVDIAAHIGGLITGFAAGYFLAARRNNTGRASRGSYR